MRKQLYPSLGNLYITQKSILLDLIEYVLKNNVFKSDGLTTTQLYFVVMGTRLAPALATIHIVDLEEDYIKPDNKNPCFG